MTKPAGKSAPSSAPVGVGEWVDYQLTAQDAERINGWPEYRRNHHAEGQCYPALVVRVFSEHTANLRVFVDGTDLLWCTSRLSAAEYGDRPGTWTRRP